MEDAQLLLNDDVTTKTMQLRLTHTEFDDEENPDGYTISTEAPMEASAEKETETEGGGVKRAAMETTTEEAEAGKGGGKRTRTS